MQPMHHLEKTAVLIFMVSLLSCERGVPAVEEGVSQSLAAYRSEMVSDIRYALSFLLPSDPGERVIGCETVVFFLKEKTSLQLDFRAGPDSVIGLKVNGKGRTADCRREHIIIDRQWLRKGANKVEVSFVADSRSLNRNPGYMYTLFVPDRARTVFPCFDQPDLKGRFSLKLELLSAWEAVSNGPVQSVETCGEWKKVAFGETPPLSTYLFAFAAGEWRKETRIRDGKPLNAYYRETDPDKTAQLDEVFAQVFHSLDWLEEYTGIPCPFEKYDFVIVPGFQFGGMEHPGTILYNDKRIFLGASPTTAEKLSRIELIAHETSHLWFGDAVTMRWFNDVWTKEVFANYFGAKISTPFFPEVNVPLRDFKNFHIPAYAEDRTAGTNAIRRDLPNLSSAGLIYGNIVYDKAPVVMRMLSELLGEEAFRDGVREYLQTYLYRNADWNELITVLDKRTEMDLRAWSRVWVEEKGMPKLSYSVQGDTLFVRQADPLGRDLVWPQRVSFGDASGETAASVWSDAPEVSVALPAGHPELLFPDPDALSYGWVVLDEATADAALAALPSVPRPEARLSLLATLYENALCGDLDPAAFAGMLGRFLHAERDPLVAGAAATYLKDLSVHGPIAGSERLENLLFDVASDTAIQGEIRLTAFRALLGVFRTEAVRSVLWEVFRRERGYLGLKLGMQDYITLAYELAIRCPDQYEAIRTVQEERLENPDLLREFRYVYRAVSPDKAFRDSLFTSLLSPENRRIEPWAASALSYLNHPLRQKEALSYIYPGLEALPEVQRTGDIFFPKNWCASLLRGHGSLDAASEVERFLQDHPDISELLKGKLLQSADHLLREKQAVDNH